MKIRTKKRSLVFTEILKDHIETLAEITIDNQKEFGKEGVHALEVQ